MGESRPGSSGQAGRRRWARPGSLARRGGEPECAQPGAPPPGGGRCCSARRPGACAAAVGHRRGRTNVNLLFVPSPLISSPRHEEVRPPPARRARHAGSLRRARRLARRPGPASAGASREPVPAFSWSDAVPGSLIPMHRLILVYTLVCANFCSYRDTSATPQSASIKALRNANLRRDGKRLGCYFILFFLN